MRDAARYPDGSRARDRFVLERRGARPQHDPWRHQGLIVEDERTAEGTHDRTATVFITGRECPWRCVMCDLWQYTTVADTPAGAVAAQVATARAALRAEPVPIAAMKLYNAGSFFDSRAVPDDDYEGVADALAGLARVVVESHPTLVLRGGARIDRFLTALARHRGVADRTASLEVAIGLETAHPDALDRLNKRFTTDRFAAATTALDDRGVALRVFLLVSPPFVPDGEQDDWLRRSLDLAFSCKATAVSLVPTRPGNGAIDALADSGLFRAPTLEDVERSTALALAHASGRGRVFADLWDLERFAQCPACVAARRERLHAMNLQQCVLPPVVCDARDHATDR
jgi:radical SAM enzyme (TIGR01210 family)